MAMVSFLWTLNMYMVSFHVSEELAVESSIFEILKIKTAFYITVQRNSKVCDDCGISSNIMTQGFTNPQKQNRPNEVRGRRIWKRCWCEKETGAR